MRNDNVRQTRTSLMFTGLFAAVTFAAGFTATGFLEEASAQSAVGKVYGGAPANSRVTLTDLETGTASATTASGSGQYTFNSVSPGKYRVSAKGFTQEVEVRAGIGSEAMLGGDVIVITGTSATINPIDVRSVESTTVFSAQQIENLPVNRELSSVALLAPGTVKNGSPGNFGNTVSIGGSSVAENGYYINGFDVTNIRTFLSYADLPYDAVAQEQVKTGGYGAEFGRSLGGVVSLVTKRGTNDWKFGGSFSYSPDAWAGNARDGRSIDPQNLKTGDFYATGADGENGYNSANRRDTQRWTNYFSGPIIKDMLFVYGAVELQNIKVNTYDRNTSRYSKYDTPLYVGKVDFYPFEGQHIEYTGIVNTDLQHVTDYAYPSGTYVGVHGDETGKYDVERGGETHIFKYTGQFFDNLTVSLQHGQLENVNAAVIPRIPNPAAGLCAAAYDSRGNASALNYIGCWDENFFRIPDLAPGKERDIRKADRIDIDYQLGDHAIRFGYDREEFTSSKIGETYSGGVYWRYFQRATAFTVNGVSLPANTLYARQRVYGTNSSAYLVKNAAWYLEDSWQLGNFLLYGGVRSESFSNYNSLGQKFVDSKDDIAPRLGVSWDVDGDGKFKIFANAGRYFIPIAANTNIRASGVEFQEEKFFNVGGIDLKTGLPTSIGAQIGATSLNGSKTPPAPASTADQSLKPMNQDEFILGAQKQFGNDLTLGVRGIYRKVNNGFDDHCTSGPYEKWAAANGYKNFDPDGNIAPCQIINPGRDVTLGFDRNSTGVITLNTIPAKYFDLPEYKRTYEAIEFFGQYSGDKVNLNASYTLSKSEGNVEGYVNSSLGQADPGLTQDFDNALFEKGAFGRLPNDHTHVIKVFGSYSVTPEFSIGANSIVQSGRPISCLGFVDLTDPSLTAADKGQLAAYAGSSFFCSRPDGTKFLSSRGQYGRTPWTFTLDMQFAYKPNLFDGHVGFYLDIQNILDTHDVIQVNERTQKGSSAAPEYSPDFLQPTAFQSPRRLTLTMRYNF